MKCLYCGAKNRKKREVCGRCGAPLMAGEQIAEAKENISGEDEDWDWHEGDNGISPLINTCLIMLAVFIIAGILTYTH